MLINWKCSDGGNKDSQQKHNPFNLSRGLVWRREHLKYEQPNSYKPDVYISKDKAPHLMPVHKYFN